MNQKNLPPKWRSLCSRQTKRDSLKKVAITLLLYAYSINMFAQVSVTVTNPGNTTPALAASYSSLALAIADLNAVVSISGPVQLTCNNGNETAPPGGYLITNTLGTSGTTITISGSTATTITAGLQTSGSAASSFDAIFKIVGGDFITIQQFMLVENPANTVTAVGLTNTMTEFGVLLTKTSTTNGAQYNTIRDNVISLNANYVNSVGIFSSSSSTSVNTAQDAASNAGTNSYNRIYGNTISNVAYGIYFICPPATATVFETGNDIGGSTLATGNTIVFGNATPGSGVWNRSQSTVEAGIYIRNGMGNSIRFNSVESTAAAYSGTTGLYGIMISSATAPVGVTYVGEISDNTINLTTTGVSLVSGIDFGQGLPTGSIIGNHNHITITVTQSAANSAPVIGIKASYPSATNTCNGNTITIHQQFNPISSLANSGALTGITLAGTSTRITANDNHVTVNQTGMPDSSASLTGAVNGIILSGTAANIDALRDSVMINRIAAMTNNNATAVFTGTVTGIAATAPASVALNIGSEGNGCLISVKETNASTGVSAFSGAISLVSMNAAHKEVNIVGNTFTTSDGTIRSTGNLDMILGGAASLSGLLTIKGNRATINRQSASGNVGFYTQTATTSGDVADSISFNTIVISGLSGTSSATVINRLGGLSTAARNICNNTITVTGTATGNVIGIVCGNSNAATISGNTISINTGSATINAISGAAGCVNAFISNNIFSLVSSSTSICTITGVNGIVAGPYQVFRNEFELLSLTTGGGTSNAITGVSIGSGDGNNVYQNNIVKLSATGSAHAGNTAITAIGVSGGVYTRVYANTISGITAEGSPGNMILTGIAISGGTNNTVFKNRVNEMTSLATGSSSIISGIRITGGTTDSIFNNSISGLTAPSLSSTDAIRGINITSSKTNSTIYVFYNTIFLNASSSGTDFGTSALYHLASATSTTAMLDLRNNMIVNTSVAAGAGLTAAYRRSQGGAGLFANVAAASNNNVLYAGTSGVVFADGSGVAQTMAAYHSMIVASGGFASVDSNSFADNPQLTTVLIPTSCRINNAGVLIASITTDMMDVPRDAGPDIGAFEFNATTPSPPSANNVLYCKDEESHALIATGSNRLLWYASPTGGKGDTIVIPSTAAAGSFVYFVADSNTVSGCISSRVQQNVTVSEPISGNTISETQTVCMNCVPALLNGSTPSGGNGTHYTYQWQSSTTDSLSGFATAAGNVTTQHYLPEALGETTWFRRVVTSGTCKGDTSQSVVIDIGDSIPENAVTGSARTICAGSIPEPLKGSAPLGGDDSTYTYQWLSSEHPDTGYTMAAGVNSAKDYAPSALFVNTWYKRVVHSGICVYDTSAAIKITVHPVVVSNTIVTPQSVFIGVQPASLIGSVPSGGDGVNYQYQWQVDSSTVFHNINGEATTINYAPPSLMRTTSYRRIVISGACADTSPAVQIVVYPLISANTIEGTQTICSGNSATVLSGSQPAGGNNMYVFRWISSTMNGTSGFTKAEGNDSSVNYDPGLVSVKTWYKRIVYSTGGIDTSAYAVVSVNTGIVSNTITGNQTVCSTISPDTIAGQHATGGNDSAYRYVWLSSVSGSNNGFTLASGSNANKDYVSGILSANTWFRRVVVSGVCAADTSPAIMVKVILPIQSNNIAGAHTICAGSLANTIIGDMPSGGNDSAYTFVWLSSVSGSANGFVLAAGSNAGKDYAPGIVSARTWFRRVVVSGGCAVDTSSAVEVKVMLPIRNNVITGSHIICPGAPANVITGHIPEGGDDSTYSYIWLSSTVGSGSGFILASGNHSSQDYMPGVLTTHSWFKRIVLSGGCVVDTSLAVEVRVLMPISNNIITGSHTVCKGFLASAIIGHIPAGGNDSLFSYFWLSSTTDSITGFGLAAGINTTIDYFPGILNTRTWFRRVVASGGCFVDTSACVEVKTMNRIENNIVMGSQVICRGSPGYAIMGSVPSGGDEEKYSYTWQSSTVLSTGVYSTANGISTTQSYNPGIVNEHTFFRRIVSSGVCPNDTSAAVLVTVNDPGTWSGAISSVWNDTNNWTCPLIPTSATNVIIPGSASNMPVIAGMQQTSGLTIETGASLTLNTNSSILAIFGAVSNNGIFANTNGRVVMAGQSPQTLPPVTFHQLEINNTSGVSLSGNTIVTDSLILTSGKLDLKGYNLVLDSNAFASGGSITSYVANTGSGKMTAKFIGANGKTGINFPVGNDEFNPVQLVNIGTSDDFTVSVIDSVADMYLGRIPVGSAITSGVVNRTWLITEAIAGGSNIHLTLGWNGTNERTGFSKNAAYIAWFNGVSWASFGVDTVMGNNPYTITKVGIDSLGVFGVGSGIVLPVKLIHFAGHRQHSDVILDWVTANEMNNMHFIVQRSTDGRQFENVSVVKGRGSGGNPSYYSYTDRHVPDSVLYYRLVQVDNDGYMVFSNTLVVDFAMHDKMEMVVYPNPFTTITGFYVYDTKDENGVLRIIDAEGKVIIEQQCTLQKGTNAFVPEVLSALQAGVYFVNLITSSQSIVQRLIKVN